MQRSTLKSDFTQIFNQISWHFKPSMACIRSSLVVAAIIMLMQLQGSMATSFVVGGPSGWGLPHDQMFYADWYHSNLPYVTGDFLDFQYARGGDSVLMVSKEDYKTCNVMNPMAAWTEGPHAFHLQGYSIVYFISGELGHCQAGQKVAIETFRV